MFSQAAGCGLVFNIVLCMIVTTKTSNLITTTVVCLIGATSIQLLLTKKWLYIDFHHLIEKSFDAAFVSMIFFIKLRTSHAFRCSHGGDATSAGRPRPTSTSSRRDELREEFEDFMHNLFLLH